MKRHLIWAIAICFLGSGTAFASTSSVEQIVEQFLPQRLIEAQQRDIASGGAPTPYSHTWKPLTASGDVVVAAYSDVIVGDIRVLKIDGGRGSLLWEAPELLDGADPQIDTMDLDGDGHLDFVVTFRTGQGRYTTTWVYLFDGKSVTDVNPPYGFGIPHFIDVDGDGVKEIVDAYTGEDGNPVQNLYRLRDGKFVKTEPVLYVNNCVRGKEKPFAQTDSFSSNVPSATLLVVNGVDGAARSAAIEVELNGQKVVSRDQLNEKVAKLTIPVTLLTDGDLANEITCTAFGKPLAMVGLLVYVASPEAGTNAPQSR